MPVNSSQHSAVAHSATAAAAESVDGLVREIKSENPDVRTDAWRGAGEVGAPAIQPLAALVADGEMEVARAAKRGLWRIVRHSGRPGADAEQQAVEVELVALLNSDRPVELHREILWMLSEIGGDSCVESVASNISNEDLREDARMALDRIPGEASLAALEAALDGVPEDFRLNIAQSLRHRGVEVPGLPCAKLVPTKSTEVKPL